MRQADEALSKRRGSGSSAQPRVQTFSIPLQEHVSSMPSLPPTEETYLVATTALGTAMQLSHSGDIMLPLIIELMLMQASDMLPSLMGFRRGVRIHKADQLQHCL